MQKLMIYEVNVLDKAFRSWSYISNLWLTLAMLLFKWAGL